MVTGSRNHYDYRSGFLGLGRTYVDQYWSQMKYKDIHTHTVSADNPIDIEFIGFDAGIITITSEKDISLNYSIENETGTTTLTAEDGAITVNGDKVVVSSYDLILDATGGIGTQQRPLVLDMQGGTLTATTTQGGIYLSEKTGDLYYDSITTGKGDVYLDVNENLVPHTGGTSLIQGGLIDITTHYGGVGTSTSLPVRIDTGNEGRDTLTISSVGHVFIEETTGDLRLYSIETTQEKDVWIKVTDGSLFDRRFGFQPDTRTIEELTALWDSMNLTGAAAEAAAQAGVDAYVMMREDEYHRYWKYRDNDLDPNDADYTVTLTDDEKDNIARSLGCADWAACQDDFDTIEQKRSDEYQLYAEMFAGVTDTHEENWKYLDATQSDLTFDAATQVSDNQITIPGGHILRTGQGILYDNSGGADLGGLEHDEFYYIIVIDDHTVQLAETKEGADNGDYISLTPGSGMQVLSDTEALKKNTVWDEVDVRYSMTGGWLKETSDTQTTVEDPNITARHITLLTPNGGVGSNEGIKIIDLSNPQELSDEDKANLAATERDDATIINPDEDMITFGVWHGLNTGDEITFPGTWELEGIEGINDGQTYYAVRVDNLAIKVSTTADGLNIVDLTVRKIYINMKEDLDLQLRDNGGADDSVVNVTAG